MPGKMNFFPWTLKKIYIPFLASWKFLEDFADLFQI